MKPAAQYVKEATNRNQEAGLNRNTLPHFGHRLTPAQIQHRQHEHAEVLSIIHYFVNKSLSLLHGVPILVVVSDADGYLLELVGDPSIKSTVTALGIEVGVQFNESECGSNVISLALLENQPVRLIGPDHYHAFLHATACYSVPFHDMETGRVLGTLSIMTTVEVANDFLLTMLITAVDSIEREALLRKQNVKLDVLNEIMINTTPNGLIVTDERGLIREFNTFAERLVGLSKPHVLGMPVDRLNVIGDIMREVVVHHSRLENMEVEFRAAAHGDHIVCLFDALPVFGKDGEFIGTLAQFRDITDRRQAEQMIIQAEKLSVIGQLGAALAHEIRNPLMSVKGFLQLLGESPSIRTDYYEIMMSELRRIEDIITEFLNTARPQKSDFRPCDIRQVIQQSLSLIQPIANMRGIEVQAHLSDDALVIFGDDSKLKQVFVNILKNAVEAMLDGGVIRVEACVSDDQSAVNIRISDQGCGIDTVTLQQVGTPFFTTKDTGTGLGLSVSSNILLEHSGTMCFDSELGIGTTVFITIPWMAMVH